MCASGEFDVHAPIFSESYGLTPNVLGLRSGPASWRHSTFHSAALPSKYPGTLVDLTRRNTTGLKLRRNRDSIELSAIEPRAAAYCRAGLKKNDVLVELNGRIAAAKAGLIELYSILCDDAKVDVCRTA